MQDFRVRTALPEEIAPVRRRLESSIGAPLPDWEVLAATASLHRGHPQERLVLSNEGGPVVHVLLQGLLRASLPTRGAQSRIYGFPTEGDIITSLEFLAAGSAMLGSTPVLAVDPANASTMTAITPTTSLCFDGATLLELARRHAIWSNLVSAVVMRHLLVRTSRLVDLLALSPERRYLKVLRDEADIVRQISQRDLALYLGVTPEALSRIAARARERRRLQPAGE